MPSNNASKKTSPFPPGNSESVQFKSTKPKKPRENLATLNFFANFATRKYRLSPDL